MAQNGGGAAAAATYALELQRIALRVREQPAQYPQSAFPFASVCGADRRALVTSARAIAGLAATEAAALAACFADSSGLVNVMYLHQRLLVDNELQPPLLAALAALLAALVAIPEAERPQFWGAAFGGNFHTCTVSVLRAMEHHRCSVHAQIDALKILASLRRSGRAAEVAALIFSDDRLSCVLGALDRFRPETEEERTLAYDVAERMVGVMWSAMIDGAITQPRAISPGEIELIAGAGVEVVKCLGDVEHWNARQSDILLAACELLLLAWPTQVQFNKAEEEVFANCGDAVNRALAALVIMHQVAQGAQAPAEFQAELETVAGTLITMRSKWTVHEEAVREAAAAATAARKAELAAAHEAQRAASHALVVERRRVAERAATARAEVLGAARAAERMAAADKAREEQLAAARAAVLAAAREAQRMAEAECAAAPAPRTNFGWTPLLLGTAATGIAVLCGARAGPAAMVGAAAMAAAAVADGGRVEWM